MFFNFQILIVFDTKEKTYLIGSLIREPGLKRFVLHAVKKYWKGRRHRWWTAFVLQFYIKKFRNSSGKLLFVIWEKSRPVRGGGGDNLFSPPFFFRLSWILAESFYMRELRFYPTFGIFPTWRDSGRGRFSWSPYYSSTLWTVVPPFWIPMKMSLTSLVYMAHWLAYRTSGLEQGIRPLFFRALSSIQTPRREP